MAAILARTLAVFPCFCAGHSIILTPLQSSCREPWRALDRVSSRPFDGHGLPDRAASRAQEYIETILSICSSVGFETDLEEEKLEQLIDRKQSKEF
jgi:hypothetical protein